MWLKKESGIEKNAEMESDFNRIEKTDAYEVQITQAYVRESASADSKSISLVVSVKDIETEATNTTYFTLTNRSGETFYIRNINGVDKKYEMFGLSLANAMFNILLGKDIFDFEPQDMTTELWDKDAKAMKETTVSGFHDLVGKNIGVTIQMRRELDGQNSKEFGTIDHFFDPKSGLFHNEEDSNNRKLDRWLNKKKEFIIKEVAQQQKSSFGKKKETTDGAEKPRKWGR